MLTPRIWLTDISKPGCLWTNNLHDVTCIVWGSSNNILSRRLFLNTQHISYGAHPFCGTQSGSISHTILTLWYTKWFNISHYTYFMVHRVVHYLTLYLLYGTQSGSISHTILTLWYTEWFNISYYTYFVVHRVVHYLILYLLCGTQSGSLSCTDCYHVSKIFGWQSLDFSEEMVSWLQQKSESRAWV